MVGPMTEKRVSQQRIAELLDLSTATVSRSLRNDPSINPDTRARVIEAATRLGYRPRQARTPRKGRGGDEMLTFEVLIGHPSGFAGDPSAAGQSMLAGVSDCAAGSNVSLSVNFIAPDDVEHLSDAERWPPAMRAGLVDGLILLYPFPRSVVQSLTRHWPVVAVSPPDHHVEADFVDTDEALAVARLVEHLAGLGHRRVGFLTVGNGLPWERQRLQGYRQGLARVGLEHDLSLEFDITGDARLYGERVAAATRLAQEGVTAWVCSADHLAYDMRREFKTRGLRVPQDVAITGYGGMAPPADCPAVTTVRVPYEELGAEAVRCLLRRLEDPRARLRDILLRHELVLGESTKKPVMAREAE